MYFPNVVSLFFVSDQCMEAVPLRWPLGPDVVSLPPPRLLRVADGVKPLGTVSHSPV